MLNSQQLSKFIDKLKNYYDIVGPVQKKESAELFVDTISDFKELYWSDQVPFYPFKKYFLNQSEDMINYQNKRVRKILSTEKPTAILGMGVLDLRALGMWDLVFTHDFYYQQRRSKTLVIGASKIPVNKQEFKTFTEQFEENVLEHLNFDLFIEQRGSEYQLLVGSRLGQDVLDRADISDYEHVQFAGFIREEGKDAKMLDLYQKVKNSADAPVWEELGRRCYACGKCSLVCPTCYCFDFYDVVGLNHTKKIRQWGSCFYPEFSQVAGGNKFLDTISKRIFYWYYHKFVAIPEKYSVPGCVSCLRCVKVCPAKIDLRETLNSLR